MNETVELFYDFSSPNAHFAAMLLPAIAARHGARIEWRPILLGGLFKLLDAPSMPGMTSPEKSAWSLKDLERFSKKYEVPFGFASRFPLSTVRPLRAALIAADYGLDPGTFAQAVFRAYWVDDKDISEPSVLGEIVRNLGADPERVLARIEEPAVKDALRQATEQARARGVFGVPSYVVKGELHFGKDRPIRRRRAASLSAQQPQAVPSQHLSLRSFHPAGQCMRRRCRSIRA
jgi:2-hydroxychromene-2-carboxylate isomerase